MGLTANEINEVRSKPRTNLGFDDVDKTLQAIVD